MRVRDVAGPLTRTEREAALLVELHNIGWRYSPRGAVTHATNIVAEHRFSVCGVPVDRFDEWRGTGSQQERDTAERMAQCRRCKNRLAQERRHQA